MAAGVPRIVPGAYRWAWIGAAASGFLLVALFAVVIDTTQRRGNRPRDFGPRAVWFLWAAGDPPVVAAEPGGAALPGTWSRDGDPRGGQVGLRGRPLPRDAGDAVPRPDDDRRAWAGGPTGVTREVGDVSWHEFARWGGLTDLDELGRDPELAGRWNASAPGFPREMTFAPDGTVHQDGIPRAVGRWAGRDRIVVVHLDDWAGEPVRRFVRDAADGSGDGFAPDFVLDDGCELATIRRVR